MEKFVASDVDDSPVYSKPVAEIAEVNGSAAAERRLSRGSSGKEHIELVVIASSTGGPTALDTVFSQLPADIKVPILIVQHMPPEFTGVLAQTLCKKYSLDVKEGSDGDRVEPGRIIIAPGGMHMTVSSSKGFGNEIRLLNTPYVNGVRPSADVLFSSVAKEYKGKGVLAVVLTGMGNDGTQGIREMKEECNCYCITQSESSCVVYGMPKCVYEAGLSDEVGELKEIAFRMYQIVRGRR
ncbi:MAG TPA: CheB methylesterase domain-containing protein [Clostridia bacterium]|nr:CheB methylesterase domain-containing protein [Clostridia bacterium]